MTAIVIACALLIPHGVEGEPWRANLVEATAVAQRTPIRDVPGWARCDEWWRLAEEVGWPAGQLPTVDRVMWCESKCRPAAYNRSGASGLMQIMPMWHDGRDPFNPETNLVMALEVWEQQGWRAWSCY